MSHTQAVKHSPERVLRGRLRQMKVALLTADDYNRPIIEERIAQLEHQLAQMGTHDIPRDSQ